jgi:hypothetical protein
MEFLIGFTIATAFWVLLVAIALRTRRAPVNGDGDLIALQPVRSDGAVVPFSSGPPDPWVEPAYLAPAGTGQGEDAGASLLYFDFALSVSDAVPASERFDELPAIVGPLARGLASLAGNEKVVGTLAGKAGYWVVKSAPGTKWMTAHGRQVAQAVGPTGRAGTRAVVVGGAAVALGPELVALGSMIAAEQILTARIERGNRIASMIHQRQMSDALAYTDEARELTARVRASSDDPRLWPESLVRRVVDCHESLAHHGRITDRIRDQILQDVDDGERLPRQPGLGDRGEAGAELSAGYEIHAAAAQLAAIRVEHAYAHGDQRAAEVFTEDLRQHIGSLQEHHRRVATMSDRKKKAFSRWGAQVDSIAQRYQPLLTWVEEAPVSFVLELGTGEPVIHALGPGESDELIEMLRTVPPMHTPLSVEQPDGTPRP